MILDEYLRGVLSLLRWRRRKLLRKAERAGEAGLPEGCGSAVRNQTALDA
ncbi:hypothetical protein [Paenibacillus arenilitoris]|uniref:Uncharacterized protein n=1 Tax=Paenibacillus arenilitoris TaxID=2772299 RepID=A0A927H968_9BACL|nr:hypothetical protein [Paenibacillus arenilitoris]MBD2872433.1 hypothetical protein [Paenibacillus arenilitoris]